MVITDNFLEAEAFNRIKNAFLDCNFPWYYHSSIDFDPTNFNSLDAPYNFQFVHSFYSNYRPNSPYLELLAPIIEKLKPNAILKIKANLLTRTSECIEHNLHVDNDPGVECYTSIFYINTNDGYTKFETGEIQKSEENKMVTFKSTLKHTGTSCTNEKCRIVLNLNYY